MSFSRSAVMPDPYKPQMVRYPIGAPEALQEHTLLKVAPCHAQGNSIPRLLRVGTDKRCWSMPSSSFCVSALPIAKSLASQTTLKGLSASGNANTGASIRDCFTDVEASS